MPEVVARLGVFVQNKRRFDAQYINSSVVVWSSKYEDLGARHVRSFKKRAHVTSDLLRSGLAGGYRPQKSLPPPRHS
eukprot:181217-Chlamydomonas_euryale.AAC.6